MSRPRDSNRKHIVVIRHAKSSWDDPSLADHDRPLSKRGRNALPRLRDHIEALGLPPDRVLCSSSRRTRETLDGIRPLLGRKVLVDLDPNLYAASAETLAAELRRLDENVRRVFLIAHNPGVEDLVDLLAVDLASSGSSIDKFSTGAVAVLSFAGRWSSLQPGCAELESFWLPRQSR